MILPKPISLRPQGSETERPRSTAPGQRYVAVLIAALAGLAALYGIGVATERLPFNSGAWVVGEDIAQRGWLAYMFSAVAHSAAAMGLWRHWRWARWLAVFLLALGLLPAVPAISAAVVDLRITGIALWGALIILRTASLYVLFSAD